VQKKNFKKSGKKFPASAREGPDFVRLSLLRSPGKSRNLAKNHEGKDPAAAERVLREIVDLDPIALSGNPWTRRPP
jgi:hypothetical protein